MLKLSAKIYIIRKSKIMNDLGLTRTDVPNPNVKRRRLDKKIADDNWRRVNPHLDAVPVLTAALDDAIADSKMPWLDACTCPPSPTKSSCPWCMVARDNAKRIADLKSQIDRHRSIIAKLWTTQTQQTTINIGSVFNGPVTMNFNFNTGK